MNRFRSLTLTAVLATVLAAGAVYAQGPGSGGRRGPGGFGPGGGLPLRALNLTEAQQEQVRTLAQQFRSQNRTVGERLRTAMDAQRKAVATIPVNEQLIRSTTQELAEAQTDMAIQQARLQTEIFGLLTPEQQAQAKKLEAERAARAKERQQQRQPR
jgi:Spy/CpxP family protein refolding chaperone